MRAQLRIVVLVLTLAVVACGDGGADTSAEDAMPASATTATVATTTAPAATTTVVPATATTLPPTTTAPPPDWRIAVVSDSLANAFWTARWSELIEEDLGLEVEILYHVYYDYVDYREVLRDPEIRADIAAADMIFIPPEADYLRKACEVGDVECRDRAIANYAIEWSEVLDEIRTINADAPLRSAKAWAWMAPPGGREGLLAFMESAGEVTEAHGGVVVDCNTMFAGADVDAKIPNKWIDPSGHFSVDASRAFAEALHALGYDA